MKKTLEQLGVGLGYRKEYRDAILAHRAEIDFVEVIAEQAFTGKDRSYVEQLADTFPLTFHGLQLSLGTMGPLDGTYVEQMKEAIDRYHPFWISDHLTTIGIDGVDIGHLAPIAFTSEMADIISAKIISLQEQTSSLFLLENIAYYFLAPGSDFDEADFLARVVERADCGILLDLNNLYGNALNIGYDPYDFLGSIPLERVVEVHIAGGEQRSGLYVDTHGHSVNAEVWNLLEFVFARSSVRAVVLERDQNPPRFEELLIELRRAREITRLLTRV